MSSQDSMAGPGEMGLASKYGADLLDHPPLVERERFIGKLAERDALDQHFARVSLEFVSRTCRRPGLDQRSRHLVQIGQFAVTRDTAHLEEVIRAAFSAMVPAREILESVFLSQIYAGETAVDLAVKVLVRIVDDLGIRDDLAKPAPADAGSASYPYQPGLVSRRAGRHSGRSP